MVSPPAAPAVAGWALETLGLEKGEVVIEALAGDASSRRYYRLRGAGESLVLVQAPPATEKNQEFLQVRELLQKLGVRVPALVAADLELGALLLEDLGDRLLLPELAADSVDASYRQAFSLLLRLAGARPGPDFRARYDEALLNEELSRFHRWFVRELLARTPGEGELDLFDAAAGVLVENALAQPRVLVHRDFHSRNLMRLADGELAVIDFQDAVRGPLTYDLVSLLRDCYIRWPEQRVREWALAYHDELAAAGLPVAASDEEFLRWFDLMGLQRHIKVLGTFARLYLRDDKPAYLRDLPLVVRYVREVLAARAPEYPALAEFRTWFEGELMPLIEGQQWWREAQ